MPSQQSMRIQKRLISSRIHLRLSLLSLHLRSRSSSRKSSLSYSRNWRFLQTLWLHSWLLQSPWLFNNQPCRCRCNPNASWPCRCNHSPSRPCKCNQSLSRPCRCSLKHHQQLCLRAIVVSVEVTSSFRTSQIVTRMLMQVWIHLVQQCQSKLHQWPSMTTVEITLLKNRR